MVKKLIFDVDEDLWKEVLKFKIDSDLPNNNEAVKELVRRALGKKKKAKFHERLIFKADSIFYWK